MGVDFFVDLIGFDHKIPPDFVSLRFDFVCFPPCLLGLPILVGSHGYSVVYKFL